MPTTPKLSKSAKLYQERMQPDHRTTRREPGFWHDLGLNAVHDLDLKPPYPVVEVLHDQGGKPPDAGLTEPWMHGEEELV